MSTATDVGVLAHLIEQGPAILSAADDVLEHGTRSSAVLARSLEVLNETVRMAREHPIVRERLRFVFEVLATRTHPAGALEAQLAQFKADAAALAR